MSLDHVCQFSFIEYINLTEVDHSPQSGVASLFMSLYNSEAVVFILEAITFVSF